jgi:hypothetical protein
MFLRPFPRFGCPEPNRFWRSSAKQIGLLHVAASGIVRLLSVCAKGDGKRRRCVAIVLTAADEMNYFVDVAGGNFRGGPAVAGKDFTVAFDGYAAGGEAEMVEKRGYRQAFGNFSGFAVDGDGHVSGKSRCID